MMGKIKLFLKNILPALFKKKEEPWLFLSERAKSFLKSHLTKIAAGSHLLVELRRDKYGKGRILTGLGLPDDSLHIKIKIEGIPFAFAGRSHYALQYVGVDIDDNENLLFFPCVDLEALSTPNSSILAFQTNKPLIAKDSLIQEGGWERQEKVNRPLLVERLFKNKFISSVYITKHRLQVELKKNASWKEHEENVAEIILEYLEGLPDPIRLFPGK